MAEQQGWHAVPCREVRADLVTRGQITEDGIAAARAEREASVAGYRLAELRTRTGMTEVQLAEAMGVSQARVSAMERGEVDTLTVATVWAYVDALGGSVRRVASLDDTDVTLRLPPAPMSELLAAIQAVADSQRECLDTLRDMNSRPTGMDTQARSIQGILAERSDRLARIDETMAELTDLASQLLAQRNADTAGSRVRR